MASMSNHIVSIPTLCILPIMPKLWNDSIEAHRRAVRDATLNATLALVTQRGLASVTMSEIAEKAGIGRATLYKYFPDVGSIMLAWHQQQIAGHMRQLVEIRDGTGGALERLEAVLHAYAEISQHSRGLLDRVLTVFLHRDKRVALAQRQLQDLVRDLLVGAAKVGDVRSDIPPDELAAFCLNAILAASSLAPGVAIRRLVTVILAGLSPPPA